MKSLLTAAWGLAVATAIADIPTYKVATEAHYAPFVFVDENSNIKGFDPDLLSAIGEKEGFKVKFSSELWDQMFKKLDNGQVQIISAGLLESPKRREKYGVSDSYAVSKRIAIFTDAKHKDKDISDLAGLRYVTQAGTTNVEYLKTLFGPDAKILGEQTQYMQIKALLKNEADVVYDDYHVLVPYLNRFKDNLYYISDNKVGSGINFVMLTQKDDLELLEKINEGLKAVKADGTYQKIYDKWFNHNAG
ncbi:transporter substrate-binding domain-containing protein [Suttonella ornithocola]|uniref:Probable amino-acid ABC transporter-binding protein HI_1080 n=1 Tax=Suttonella ornithocola TaxID=279832 RepID=A0A380MNZ2_9GAMM|nr:transporter substrate-binding domain-containing protein [Suttonella ornithocola]SUO94339.1 Probable amino-acid ABC transporter-binding protein HI_1080 precursor [Suttonella ornithocola]